MWSRCRFEITFYFQYPLPKIFQLYSSGIKQRAGNPSRSVGQKATVPYRSKSELQPFPRINHRNFCRLMELQNFSSNPLRMDTITAGMQRVGICDKGPSAGHAFLDIPASKSCSCVHLLGIALFPSSHRQVNSFATCLIIHRQTSSDKFRIPAELRPSEAVDQAPPPTRPPGLDVKAARHNSWFQLMWLVGSVMWFSFFHLPLTLTYLQDTKPTDTQRVRRHSSPRKRKPAKKSHCMQRFGFLKHGITRFGGRLFPSG